MARFLHHDFSRLSCSFRVIILALFWILGLICGIVLFLLSELFQFISIQNALSGPVTFFRLLCIVFAPFLLSVLAVYVRKTGFLFITAFLKAFVFSIIAMAIRVSFGSAGWLVFVLLMFTDLMSLPLLLFYWIRNLSGESTHAFVECLTFISIGFLICCIDYSMIVPFLISLSNA